MPRPNDASSSPHLMLRARNRSARSGCLSAEEVTIQDDQSLAVRAPAAPVFGDVSSDLWMADDDGSDQQRLTDQPAFCRRGSATADGTKLAFASDRDDRRRNSTSSC